LKCSSIMETGSTLQPGSRMKMNRPDSPRNMGCYPPSNPKVHCYFCWFTAIACLTCLQPTSVPGSRPPNVKLTRNATFSSVFFHCNCYIVEMCCA
jgi:hypothetical protein